MKYTLLLVVALAVTCLEAYALLCFYTWILVPLGAPRLQLLPVILVHFLLRTIASEPKKEPGKETDGAVAELPYYLAARAFVVGTLLAIGYYTIGLP